MQPAAAILVILHLGLALEVFFSFPEVLDCQFLAWPGLGKWLSSPPLQWFFTFKWLSSWILPFFLVEEGLVWNFEGFLFAFPNQVSTPTYVGLRETYVELREFVCRV